MDEPWPETEADLEAEDAPIERRHARDPKLARLGDLLGNRGAWSSKAAGWEAIRDELGDPALEVGADELAAAKARRVARQRREAVRASGIEITPDDLDAVSADRLRGIQCDESCAAFVLANPNRSCADYHADNLVKRWLARATSPANGKPAPQFLGLCGGTGRGKTVACAWAIAEMLGGISVSASNLINYRRENRERLHSTRLVVLDDLGTEDFAPERFATALFDVVNRRQRERWMLTLLTSNLARDAFVTRYDERTVKRIKHRGFIANVLGRDMRESGE